MREVQQRAEEWLRRTYRGQVELLAPGPVAEESAVWLFTCGSAAVGRGKKALLNASLAVPKNGSLPFHPATDDPLGDVAAFAGDPRPRELAQQARQINTRGCILTVNAALSGGHATALPWRPEHETPGWWERLLRQCDRQFETSACQGWDEIWSAMEDAGVDARGVVWIRRRTGDWESTGHLLYVHNNDGRIVLLDALRGGLGTAEDQGVHKLTLAVLQGTGPGRQPFPEPAAVADAGPAVQRRGGQGGGVAAGDLRRGSRPHRPGSRGRRPPGLALRLQYRSLPQDLRLGIRHARCRAGRAQGGGAALLPPQLGPLGLARRVAERHTHANAPTGAGAAVLAGADGAASRRRPVALHPPGLAVRDGRAVPFPGRQPGPDLGPA